jgi:hypothetical protein
MVSAPSATMLLLAAQALAADPLAASQPGFTILDPLSASMLGLFLFGEHIQAGIADLAGTANGPPPMTGLLDGVRGVRAGCLCCAAGPYG